MKLYMIGLPLIALCFQMYAQQVTDSATSKILLAMEPTSFKKALIKQMTTLLDKKPVDVTVIKNHKKEIADYSASDYNAVFITCSGVNSKVRPWINKWIDNNKSDSSKILLHITKTREWDVDVYVDAVSSASAKKKVSELSEQYVNMLLKKIPSDVPEE